MLIAVSGSQGTGKTTTLKELHNRGYNINHYKTARSVLTEWGMALEEITSNHELTVEFQNLLFHRKKEEEKILMEEYSSSDIVFTERTYADLFSYALFSLGRFNEYSDWLDNYYDACMQAQQIYDQVFYITAGHFLPVSDGVRGANKHYSRMADLVMTDITTNMTVPDRLIMISNSCLTDRVNSIIYNIPST